MATLTALGLRPWIALGAWLQRIPYFFFALGLGALTLLHTGFRLPWLPDADYFMVATNWPSGSTWDSSILWILIPDALGLTAPLTWSLLWASLALITMVFVARKARTALPQETRRLFLLTTAASGIPLLLVSRLGFYDIPFILGVTIAALAGRRWWIIGPIIIALTNAEMGLVAGVAGILTALSLRDAEGKKRSLAVLVFSILGTVAVFLLQAANSAPVGANRATLLPENAAASLSSNLIWFPLLVATLYLGAWIVVGLIVTSTETWHSALLIMCALIVLPLVSAIVTLDGTRVAVGTSSLAFFLATRAWFNRGQLSQVMRSHPQVLHLSLSLLTLLMLLSPAISVFAPNVDEGVFPPWEAVYALLTLATSRVI